MAMKRTNTAGVTGQIFGQGVIVDIFTKHGIRRSPGQNNRTRAVGKCAREAGKDTAKRKACFATKGPSGGGKTQGGKKK